MKNISLVANTDYPLINNKKWNWTNIKKKWLKEFEIEKNFWKFTVLLEKIFYLNYGKKDVKNWIFNVQLRKLKNI